MHIYKNWFTHLEPATGLGTYEGIFINPQSDSINLSDPASAVIIEKNKFSGALIRAITTQRSGTVISKNRIRTDWEAPEELSGFPRGIQLSKAEEDTPADSTDHQVIKNKIEDKGAAPFSVGILVRDQVTDCFIEKNKVTGTLGVGINLETSNGNNVEKNQIKFSFEDGLFAGGNDNKIIKNIIKNSGNDGLIVEGLRNTLTKNIIQKSGGIGIHLSSGSADNSIVKNKVKKSEYLDIVDDNDSVEDNDYEKTFVVPAIPREFAGSPKRNDRFNCMK